MSWYRASTISLTNGSTAVTGAATDFIANCAVGEGLLAPDGKVYEIAAIVSATALTLGSAYLGSTASGQSYAIIPSQSYLRDLALQAATLVNDYQSVLDSAGAGKFGDGTLGSPGIQFSSDSNSGIRRTGTDALAVVTGGVDRITVDAAGAVAVVASLSVAGSAVPTIASTSTLTNKTLALGSNTVSGTTAQFNTALTDGDFATLAGTETLTNKTLTAPVLANPSYSGATANGGTVTTIDINGGTIDGTVIGGSSAAAGSFTTLSASGNVDIANGVGYRWGTGAVQIYSNGTYLRARTNSVDRLELTDAGLAVTGALSATGLLSSNNAAGRVSRLGGLQISGTTSSSDGGNNIIASGTYWNGTNFTATQTTAAAVQLANGAIYLYTESGLTPSGTYSGAIRATLDASGNLGLGVTPSAWVSSWKAVDVTSGGSSLYGTLAIGGIATNAFFDSSPAWKYKTSYGAARYEHDSIGSHKWFTAPSGTAGNAITFTQAMTLDASGNLGLGVTPSAWAGTSVFQGGNAYALSTDGAQSNSAHLSSNAVRTASGSPGTWNYLASNTATLYQQKLGAHAWYTAPSGTAGTAITFTQAMTLDASSNLSVTGSITTGSYTVATRPAHAAGRIIHVTDGGAGAVFQGSAGGAWVNLG